MLGCTHKCHGSSSCFAIAVPKKRGNFFVDTGFNCRKLILTRIFYLCFFLISGLYEYRETCSTAVSLSLAARGCPTAPPSSAFGVAYNARGRIA